MPLKQFSEPRDTDGAGEIFRLAAEGSDSRALGVDEIPGVACLLGNIWQG